MKKYFLYIFFISFLICSCSSEKEQNSYPLDKADIVFAGEGYNLNRKLIEQNAEYFAEGMNAVNYYIPAKKGNLETEIALTRIKTKDSPQKLIEKQSRFLQPQYLKKYKNYSPGPISSTEPVVSYYYTDTKAGTRFFIEKIRQLDEDTLEILSFNTGFSVMRMARNYIPDDQLTKELETKYTQHHKALIKEMKDLPFPDFITPSVNK